MVWNMLCGSKIGVCCVSLAASRLGAERARILFGNEETGLQPLLLPFQRRAVANFVPSEESVGGAASSA